jgi:hypothetical protein
MVLRGVRGEWRRGVKKGSERGVIIIAGTARSRAVPAILIDAQ